MSACDHTLRLQKTHHRTRIYEFIIYAYCNITCKYIQRILKDYIHCYPSPLAAFWDADEMATCSPMGSALPFRCIGWGLQNSKKKVAINCTLQFIVGPYIIYQLQVSCHLWLVKTPLSPIFLSGTSTRKLLRSHTNGPAMLGWHS